MLHVAYMDFGSIREGKTLIGSDTNCRTGEATIGGWMGPLKIIDLRARDFDPKFQPENPIGT
jgi:hypothetical protein